MAQIEIYPFSSNDIADLHTMHKTQNADLPEISSYLPEIGFIVRDEKNTPVAAGFLRKLEGNFGMLDTYVSNASLPAETRHQAIELITQTIEITAKNLGLNGLLFFTAHNSIGQRALDRGYRLTSNIMMVKDLKS